MSGDMGTFQVGFAFLIGSVLVVLFMVLVYAIIRQGYQYEQRKRELVHQERIKALAMGIAPADPLLARTRSAAVIGTLIPLAFIAAAAYVTYLGTQLPEEYLKDWFGFERGPALIFVIWFGCGVVVLLTVWSSLRTIRRMSDSKGQPRGSRVPTPPPTVVDARVGEDGS